MTRETVQVIAADAGITGEDTAAVAQQAGIRLIVVKGPEATSGFVLLPKRWAMEHSFAWASRFLGLRT